MITILSISALKSILKRCMVWKCCTVLRYVTLYNDNMYKLTHQIKARKFTRLYLLCLYSVTLSCGAEGLEALTNLIQAGPSLVQMDNQHSISGWHFATADQLPFPCVGRMFEPEFTPWPFAWHGDKQHRKPLSSSPCTIHHLRLRFKCLKWNQVNGMMMCIGHHC